MPNRRATIKLDEAAIRKFLKGAEVEGMLLDRAERIEAAAKAAAPVSSDADPGTYRDSIFVEAIRGENRTIARVYADVPYALAVEAEHGTLARALKGSA